MLKFGQVEILESSSIQFTHTRFNYIISPKQRNILTLNESRIHKGDRSARNHEQAISIRHGHQIIGKQTSLSVLIGIICVFVDILFLTHIDHKQNLSSCVLGND